jgi:hypothetical protein
MLLLLLLLLLMMIMMILRDGTKLDTCKNFGPRRRVFAHLFYITSHFSNLAYSCLEDGGSCFSQTLVLYHQRDCSVSAFDTTEWLCRRATPHFICGASYCVMLGNTFHNDILRRDSSTYGMCEESKQNCSLYKHAKDHLRDAGNMLRSLERRRKHAGGHLRDAGNMLEVT